MATLFIFFICVRWQRLEWDLSRLQASIRNPSAKPGPTASRDERKATDNVLAECSTVKRELVTRLEGMGNCTKAECGSEDRGGGGLLAKGERDWQVTADSGRRKGSPKVFGLGRK